MSRKSQWVLVAVVAAGALAVFAWMVWPPPVSRQEAIQAIREFERDSLLDPGQGGLLTTKWGAKTAPYVGFYLFARADPSVLPPVEWSVDCVTGEVVMAKHPERIRRLPADSHALPKIKDQCRRIGEAFARSKYRGFDNMGFRLIGADEFPESSTWVFRWEQPGNLWNHMYVSVSTADGSIVEYKSGRDPNGPSYLQPSK